MASDKTTGIAPYDPDKSEPFERYVDAMTGDVWEVIGYIVDPAALMQNTRTKERHIEVIGCQNDKDRWRRT